MQFRPERKTPNPRVPGTINAHMYADGDRYAELDDDGRYKVRPLFHTVPPPDGGADSPNNAAQAPKPMQAIRMAQPHGGPDEGLHFPLRRGTEVLLTFVDGNPDRPVVAGAVPNPDNPSVITSKDQTKCRIQTSGGEHPEETLIEIENDETRRRMTLYSPHKATRLRLGAPDPDVDKLDKEKKTDGGRFTTDGLLSVAAKGGSVTEISGAIPDSTISGIQPTGTYAYRKNVTGNSHYLYTGTRYKKVTGTATVKYGADKSETIVGKYDLEVGSAAAAKKLSLKVTGDMEERITGKHELHAGKTAKPASTVVKKTDYCELLSVDGNKGEIITKDYDLDVQGKADLHYNELEIHVKSDKKEFYEGEKVFRWYNEKGIEIYGVCNEIAIFEDSNIRGIIGIEVTLGLMFEYASLLVDLHLMKVDVGIAVYEKHAIKTKQIDAKIKSCLASIKQCACGVRDEEIDI